MSFGFGFALPHWQTLSGGAFNPLSLFQGGVQGVWYDPSDSTTLFSDPAGTTPSPTPGAGALSVVGAMLDKRAPSYSVFFDGTGDYLSTPNDTALQLTNSIAFTIECWINPSSIGTARFVFKNYLDSGLFSGYAFGIGCDGSDSQLQFWDGNTWRKFGLLSANVWTHVAITYEGSGTTGRVFVNGSQAGASFTINSNINATTGTALVGAQSASLGFFPGYISNLRVVKGTAVYTANFTPPTSPLSPISGTSLLTCGTSWTGNPAITVNGDSKISQINPFVASPLGNHAISYNTTTARPELSARVNLLNATATLSTQSVTTQATNYTLYFTGSGSITLSGTATGTFNAGSNTVTCTAGTLTLTVSGSVTTADLRPANVGTSVPAYQAVTSTYTYDSSDFPRYLVFNGVASGMYTPANLNLSGTDKATVFAGVRKLVDGFYPAIVELSANPSTSNPGSFSVAAAGSNVPRYAMTLSQTATTWFEPQTYTAPISNVLSVAYDIGQSTRATEVVPRVNGVLNQTNPSGSAESGTGNFGTYPLNIGVRSATATPSLFLNGYLYSLIVVGAASTAAQISSTESWINVKEGGVY